MLISSNEVIIIVPTDQAGDYGAPISEPAASIFRAMANQRYYFTDFANNNGNCVECRFAIQRGLNVADCVERAEAAIKGDAS